MIAPCPAAVRRTACCICDRHADRPAPPDKKPAGEIERRAADHRRSGGEREEAASGGDQDADRHGGETGRRARQGALPGGDGEKQQQIAERAEADGTRPMNNQNAVKIAIQRDEEAFVGGRIGDKRLRTAAKKIKPRMAERRQGDAASEQGKANAGAAGRTQQAVHPAGGGKIENDAERGGQYAPQQALRRSAEHQRREIGITRHRVIQRGKQRIIRRLRHKPDQQHIGKRPAAGGKNAAEKQRAGIMGLSKSGTAA